MLSRPLLFRRFHKEDKGLAALEFALILPVLISMLFGMGELSLAVFCRTDIAQIASSVADLVAQENSVSATDLSNVYYAGNTILYPYYPTSTTPPSIRITSINYDATSADPNWIGKVSWTCGQAGSGTLPTPTPVANSAYTLPKPTMTTGTAQPMLAVGGSVIMVEVSYAYASPTSMVLIGAKTMTSTFYTKPRRVGQIPKPTSCT